MVLVKILKRRDASSVIVAVAVAMVLYNLAVVITGYWANKLSGLNAGQPVNGWKVMYLQPLVSALLQLVVLEVLGWLWVGGLSLTKKK